MIDVAGQVDAWAVLVDLTELNIVALPAKKKKSWLTILGVVPVDPQGAQLDLAVLAVWIVTGKLRTFVKL